MVNKKFLKEAKKIVNFLIKNYEFKDNVISIYAMGSFAEGIVSESSDIDLNIFLKKADFRELVALRKALRITQQKFGRKIDNNIITAKETKVIDTMIFPHKYRHALLIYEIKHYNCLLYGKDILRKVRINYSDLYEETIKLLLTLGYRIRKIYLAGGTIKESKKQAVKFVTYACKFALINKGIYVYDNDKAEKEFLKEFSYLRDISIIEECFEITRTNKKKISLDIFKRAVNFIERLSEERLQEFLKRKMRKEINFNEVAKVLFKEIKIPKKELEKNYFIILVGTPGSGKTTLARGLSKKYNFVRVSTDNIKSYLRKHNYSFEIKDLFKIQRKIFHKLLDKRVDIISDSNSDLKKYRHSLQKLAKSRGYKPIVIYLRTSINISYQRILKKKKLLTSNIWRQRPTNFQDNLEIPRKAIEINGDLEKNMMLSGAYRLLNLS